MSCLRDRYEDLLDQAHDRRAALYDRMRQAEQPKVDVTDKLLDVAARARSIDVLERLSQSAEDLSRALLR